MQSYKDESKDENERDESIQQKSLKRIKDHWRLFTPTKPSPGHAWNRWLNIVGFLALYCFQYVHDPFLFGAISNLISRAQSREKALLAANKNREKPVNESSS